MQIENEAQLKRIETARREKRKRKTEQQPKLDDGKNRTLR